MNIWNHKTVCLLSVLDKKTWYHIAKLFRAIIVYKSYNCEQTKWLKLNRNNYL